MRPHATSDGKRHSGTAEGSESAMSTTTATAELFRHPGTIAHDLVDFLRIEASLLAEHQRLGNSDSGDLAEHVVDQLHRQSMPEPARTPRPGCLKNPWTR